MPAWTVCTVCGALVADEAVHDAWHASTPPPTTTP